MNVYDDYIKSKRDDDDDGSPPKAAVEPST